MGRPFWAMCSAGAISAVGNGAVVVGFPLLAATLTRSALLISAVVAVQRLPWLLLSLLTGALADRFDTRRLLGLVETGRMIAIGGLGAAVVFHVHPLLVIYLAAFCLGAFDTAFGGATNALVPRLVGRSVLGRANGYLYASSMAGEDTVGRAVGGLLAAAALSLPFLFDSATFAASAAILLVALPRRSYAAGAPRPRRAGSLYADAREGLRWFLGDPTVRLVAAFIAVLAFCQAAVFGVLVLWALHTLHLSRAGFGLLLTAASIGVVVSSVVSGRLTDRFGAGRLLVGGGVAAGLAYLVIGLTGSVLVGAVALLVESAGVGTGNVASLALRQALIPDELLGRVGNAMRTCIFGVMPLGALAGGALASGVSLRATFIAASALQLAVVGGTCVTLTRRIRQSHVAARAGVPAPTPVDVAYAS